MFQNSQASIIIGARRRGGNLGQLPPPWNLKMITSYDVPVENTLRFSLAPSALPSNTLKFSLKRRNRENFSSRLRRAKKYVIFVSPRGFAPPLWKNSCGRPCSCTQSVPACHDRVSTTTQHVHGFSIPHAVLLSQHVHVHTRTWLCLHCHSMYTTTVLPPSQYRCVSVMTPLCRHMIFLAVFFLLCVYRCFNTFR